jgi:hypothetical protein
MSLIVSHVFQIVKLAGQVLNESGITSSSNRVMPMMETLKAPPMGANMEGLQTAAPQVKMHAEVQSEGAQQQGLQQQINRLNHQIESLNQAIEKLIPFVSELVAEHHNGYGMNGELVGHTNHHRTHNSYHEMLSDNKDILSDSDMFTSNHLQSEKTMSPELQIQRLTAQLTAAYNRIASLEEQLLSRRVG